MEIDRKQGGLLKYDNKFGGIRNLESETWTTSVLLEKEVREDDGKIAINIIISAMAIGLGLFPLFPL